MMFKAEIMETIAKTEIEEIKKTPKKMFKSLNYRYLINGKLLMLLQLGILSQEEYQTIITAWDCSEDNTIKDQITNGGF
ncbi:MAG: hypothetical protein J6T10_20925 [Methanobrevibacter sp.]|nr:hypothetical protein [Methanobrevibacter sp.]